MIGSPGWPGWTRSTIYAGNQQVVHRPSCDHPGEHADPVHSIMIQNVDVYDEAPIPVLCRRTQPPQDLPRPPHCGVSWLDRVLAFRQRMQRARDLSLCFHLLSRKTQKAIPLQDPETVCPGSLPAVGVLTKCGGSSGASQLYLSGLLISHS